MVTTPQSFFQRNLKWIALALLFLLCIKSIQSCNRGTLLNITKGQYIHTIDSLEKKYYTLLNQYDDTTKMLKFELRIAKEKAQSANDKANAVQSVAEKIRANTTTTVNVRGAEIDTIKRK